MPAARGAAKSKAKSASASRAAAPFRFTRRVDSRKLRTLDLAQVMQVPDLSAQTWLMVNPHDDDLPVGAGLWIQAAVNAGVDVRALVVTDGRMGYCTLEQKGAIAQIRRDETYRAFEILGVARDKVVFLGYPDGDLTRFRGRRSAQQDEPALVGHTGLQNAFTYHLRAMRPARVFVPAFTDYHPDHQITHNELMISLFHASGSIWPELGQPLATVPKVCEVAVYCDYDQPPNLEVIADENVFATKLRAIEAFQSQTQIAAMVDGLRQAGPYEYLHEVTFKLYTPEPYKKMFA